MKPDTLSRYRDCLQGLAVGDAVGTTLEFRRPGTFEPVNEMLWGGPFGLKPGQWTDDRSSLCREWSHHEIGSGSALSCREPETSPGKIWRESATTHGSVTCIDACRYMGGG